MENNSRRTGNEKLVRGSTGNQSNTADDKQFDRWASDLHRKTQEEKPPVLPFPVFKQEISAPKERSPRKFDRWASDLHLTTQEEKPPVLPFPVYKQGISTPKGRLPAYQGEPPVISKTSPKSQLLSGDGGALHLEVASNVIRAVWQSKKLDVGGS